MRKPKIFIEFHVMFEENEKKTKMFSPSAKPEFYICLSKRLIMQSVFGVWP